MHSVFDHRWFDRIAYLTRVLVLVYMFTNAHNIVSFQCAYAVKVK